MSEHSQATLFPARQHNHKVCVAEALRRAEVVCEERELRLTAIRRRVLELIWANHQPTKAYDLLEQIRGEPFSVAPPTIYRALDFLLDAGLVHRIESLNAFVGCDAAHEHNHPKFLICRRCERVAELSGERVARAIAREASNASFLVEQEVVELLGLCGVCAKT